MRGIEIFLTQPFVQSAGWTLLHFIWQGALVALLLAGALAALRGRSANLRYGFACAALALMLALPLVTFWKMNAATPETPVDEMSLPVQTQTPTRAVESAGDGMNQRTVVFLTGAATPVPLQHRVQERLEGLLPLLIVAWLLGVVVLSLRMLGGLLMTARLKRRQAHAVADCWQETVRRLSTQLRVKKQVRLLESTLVRVPTAIGWLRPVILLPASALVGMTPQHLEAILAHELAHIRRHDYLVNLGQVFIETLLFYHPAVWWVSRQVRLEREHACDDLAVALSGGDALNYARALAKIERLRKGAPCFAVAANGGELLQRIRRLVGVSHQPRRASTLLAGLVVVVALLTACVGAGAVLSRKQPAAPRAAEKKDAPPSNENAQANANGLNETNDASAAGQTPPAETATLVARDETTGEDLEMRRAALAALGKHAGTVVIMEPKTGRVYTVVNQDWALRSGWSPASTMKLVTSLASIGEKTLDPNELVRVPSKKTPLNLDKALAFSDNPYFQMVGERVGAEKILSYAHEVGLGEATGINFEGERAGVLPPFKKGLNAAHLGAHGEGVEVTPLQLAALASAIANGGALLTPRVPRNEQESAQFAAQVRRRINIPRETLERIVPGMAAAVDYGTGNNAFNPSLKIAGKTGTTAEKGEAGTGLFMSYAPLNDPRLVVVVAIRGQDEHGATAAGIAGKIYSALKGRL